MTIHCAKGLEFPVVFLAGLEERLFPHALSADSSDDLEEERRLCYVAMTRAQQRLVLSYARQRRVQGVYMPSEPSRFTREIPAELLQPVIAADDGAASRRGEFGFRPRVSQSSAIRAASRREAREAPAPRYPAGPPPEDGWAVGARIRHPSFGSGQIVDREGSGRTVKLTIRFAECGTKVILPAYVRLELVSSAGTSPSH
jgi:DNA helicase-2/ATP-dependent DNA helicase PcrA